MWQIIDGVQVLAALSWWLGKAAHLHLLTQRLEPLCQARVLQSAVAQQFGPAQISPAEICLTQLVNRMWHRSMVDHGHPVFVCAWQPYIHALPTGCHQLHDRLLMMSQDLMTLVFLLAGLLSRSNRL